MPKCTFFCAFQDDGDGVMIGGVSGASENMEKCNYDGIWEGYNGGPSAVAPRLSGAMIRHVRA